MRKRKWLSVEKWLAGTRSSLTWIQWLRFLFNIGEGNVSDCLLQYKSEILDVEKLLRSYILWITRFSRPFFSYLISQWMRTCGGISINQSDQMHVCKCLLWMLKSHGIRLFSFFVVCRKTNGQRNQSIWNCQLLTLLMRLALTDKTGSVHNCVRAFEFWWHFCFVFFCKFRISRKMAMTWFIIIIAFAVFAAGAISDMHFDCTFDRREQRNSQWILPN